QAGPSRTGSGVRRMETPRKQNESVPFARLKSRQVQKLMPNSISLVLKKIFQLLYSHRENELCTGHMQRHCFDSSILLVKV
uniref:Uncharacterized protein n=2 Tax=Ursus TaxID=9639 RepID=A0A452U0J5_URSMA